MFTSKIIASFSSVGLKRSNKNIENVVASIVQYNREIDYNRLLEKIEIMSKLTSIFSNKKYENKHRGEISNRCKYKNK